MKELELASGIIQLVGAVVFAVAALLLRMRHKRLEGSLLLGGVIFMTLAAVAIVVFARCCASEAPFPLWLDWTGVLGQAGFLVMALSTFLLARRV